MDYGGLLEMTSNTDNVFPITRNRNKSLRTKKQNELPPKVHCEHQNKVHSRQL